ncbi:hypothetical protein MJ3_09588 [Salimicrobium jeotgali]|uniref:Uncharacterized protein n=1 Tax=Salimicrobium jeotgali TaxID=1230341 RepID=K2GA54_9BACI|nr:hypothetical protein MJ3_09588 [Salimicrobium jeotgali]
MTYPTMAIITTPKIGIRMSITFSAFLTVDMTMAIIPVMTAPIFGEIPKSTLIPRPAPATFPILKAMPPSTISAAT